MRTTSLFALLLAACGSSAMPIDGGSDAPAMPADGGSIDAGSDASTPDWTFETLDTRTETVLDVPRAVELVRATRPDGAHTYLLYIHAQTMGAPLVVLNEPYDGIDWTGEDVDARWEALGNGLHPDVDGPGVVGTDVINYQLHTVTQTASDSAAHLLNGFAVVHVYARFYAGGSLEDDVRDASAAFYFARSRAAELDATRIASYGGSWGGMMALFGASRAPSEVTIRQVVALSAPSDFADLWDYTGVRVQMLHPDPAVPTAFYSPYRRRILASTGGHTPTEDASAWLPYEPAALCAGLRGPALVPHDQWDELVPFTQTPALVAACPAHVSGLYWLRDGPVDFTMVPFDHGPFGAEPGLASVVTFSFLRMHLALVSPSTTTVIGLAHDEAIRTFLQLVHDAKARGQDVSTALPALHDLCDPRVELYDPTVTPLTMTTGAALTSTEVNTVFGTSTTPANVCAMLDAILAP